tara:strand:- start:335 stop:706 length:372 start_codon:yes stop_codon:yes gene_type:complete
MKFICKYVNLISNHKNLWVSEKYLKKVISYPIAHQDGNYYASSAIIQKLEDENRIIFRYCSMNGKVDQDSNINGSINNIAGIVNDNGRILGMMPHPERAISKNLGGSDGIHFFQNIMNRLGNI